MLEQHGAHELQLRCLCITCPLAFRYGEFLPVEPSVLSYCKIWIFHNPVLEWLFAGHLAGWHRICACLTSPCFSGVILVGCSWCLLPLTSSQQGLVQPAAPFLNSSLAQFAASRQHVQRSILQEWALFVFKMVLVLYRLSCFSLCFLWQCFVLLVCYRGRDGTCPHIVCLTPGLCTVHSALWEYFKINVRIVQTDLKCGVFLLWSRCTG